METTSIPGVFVRRAFCWALLFVLFLASCKKSNKSGGGNDLPGERTIITLKGCVVDESGRPIKGATVKADGQQTTTADNGTFTLFNIKTSSGSMVLVNCSRTGYRTQIRRAATAGGNNAALYVAMPYKDVTSTFQTTSGATAELPGGATVQIPANAVVKADGSAYTGAVQLAVHHLSPDDPDFGLKIPGGDLSGVRTDNTPVVLYSFGMVDVEMTTAAGEKLQLKNGQTSNIKFPIAADQRSMAPAEIPLWHFDEATGLWKEEGKATRQGDVYVGTVGHFSTWNVDAPLRTATVKGRLTDACANGVPLRGVVLTLGQMSVQTDNDGNYLVRLPAGVPFTISVDPRQNIGRTISKEIAPLAEGATSVQDIALPCGAALSGRITQCGSSAFSTFVTLELNGVVFAQTYTDVENKFKLFGPKGAGVIVKAFNPVGGTVMVPTMMPDQETVSNIPDIEICEPEVNLEATFMLRSVGSEQQYRIEGGTAIGVTDAGGGKTTCAVEADDWRISLTIPGITEGNYQSGYIVLDFANVRFIAEKAQIKVTRFGAVGELIEGTFTGIATPVSPGNKVEILNGRFTVRRVAG